MMRIAALAHRHGVACSPHNPTGPICNFASMHLMTASTNFSVLEFQLGESDLYFDVVAGIGPQLIEGRFAAPPDVPGLGLVLDDAVLAAQAAGADFAYIGSAFIATQEARASEAYKQAIVDSNSDDIVYSNLFTGVHGNYLAPSIRNAGLDPDHLPESDPSKMNFGGDKTKAWKDIWGCGQGIGAITKIQSTADYVAQLKREYAAARERLKLA